MFPGGCEGNYFVSWTCVLYLQFNFSSWSNNHEILHEHTVEPGNPQPVHGADTTIIVHKQPVAPSTTAFLHIAWAQVRLNCNVLPHAIGHMLIAFYESEQFINCAAHFINS